MHAPLVSEGIYASFGGGTPVLSKINISLNFQMPYDSANNMYQWPTSELCCIRTELLKQYFGV